MPFKIASSSVNFDTRWTTYRHSNPIQAPVHWRKWLCNRDSLTEHLITASDNQFKVELQKQHWALPHRSEAKILGLKTRQLALIREVKLIGKNSIFVIARTIIPSTTLTGKQKQLSMLGNKSLGSLLFRDPNLKRGKFQIARIQLLNKQTAWARRSVFFLSHKPLLVCEMFLPILETIDYSPPLLPNRMITRK